MDPDYDVDFCDRIYAHIENYTQPSWYSSIFHFTTTMGLFYTMLQLSTLWAIPLLALVLIRMFVIFHDLGHNSFFPNKTANQLAGTLTSVVVFTPLSNWSIGHNEHHRNSNKIDHAQYSQTAPWTTDDYDKSHWLMRIAYRFIYGRYTLFTINPLIYFLAVLRFYAKWYENLMQIMYVAFMYNYLDSSQYWYIGLAHWLAAALGVMMFHVQHTFSGAYKAHDRPHNSAHQQWDHFLNGMYGSSHFLVPSLAKFFTLGIEYHHIHHLNSRVPSYRLQNCHDEGGDLFQSVKEISVGELVASLPLSIYHTASHSYIDVYQYIPEIDKF